MAKLKPILLLALFAACDRDCLQSPCPLPLAITLDVTSTSSGATVSGASVQISGSLNSTMSCDAHCSIHGYPGSYTLTVMAPGYQAAARTVTVQGTTPAACECGSAVTEHVTVALTTA